MEGANKQSAGEKSGLQGMNKVIGMMSKQFNTNDPLVLCKKMLEYLNSYTEQLEEKRKEIAPFEGDLSGKSSQEETVEKVEKKKIQFLKRQEKEKEKDKDEIIYPSRKTKWIKNISAQEQRAKYEEQKFIAMSFCEHGINFHYITQHFPKMTPKTYRCYVEAVNNQNVNEIVDFLRYECNVQVERLNRDQKRSIRTQLTKIKQWLGNMDPAQLVTFYRFIHRHYDKSIEIVFDDALKLYKTIIQIIKSPFVNVLEAQEGAETGQSPEESLSQEEQKAMVILYIKHRDVNKVADGMCQKYGYDMRWSIHSVKFKLRHVLDAAVTKLVSNFKQKEADLYQHYFDAKRRQLLQDSGDQELKIKLLSYFLEKRTGYIKVKDLLQRLREFYEIHYPESISEPSIPKIEQTIPDQVKKEEVSIGVYDNEKEEEKEKEEKRTEGDQESIKEEAQDTDSYEQP